MNALDGKPVEREGHKDRSALAIHGSVASCCYWQDYVANVVCKEIVIETVVVAVPVEYG